MINFKRKQYPSVIVNLPFGKRKISSVELNESLMNFDGSYFSDEARVIDEKIFYYIENDFLFLCEGEIVKKILSEI